MNDVVCYGMGILDIICGIVIMIGFGLNFFATILGVIIILKGVMSFL